MKKLIVSLLAVAAMASCTKNNVDVEGPVVVPEGEFSLKAKAEAKEVSSRTPFQDAISSTNPLTAAVYVKLAGASDYSTVYASGNMTFVNADEVAFDASPAPAGKTYYPADDSELSMFALYPATGWATPTAAPIFTFTGKEDVMVAEEVTSKKSLVMGASPVYPAFTFEHLLTKLDIRMRATSQAAVDAWGEITKIELVGINGSAAGNLNSKVLVGDISDLSEAHTYSTTVSTFGFYKIASTVATDPDTTPNSGDETYTYVYGDDAYTFTIGSGVTLPIVEDTDTGDIPLQAYSIVAPITATGTADYMLRVYAKNATGGYYDVKVNLKDASDNAFAGSTMGYQFDITLTFKSTEIEATATVEAWEDGGNIEEEIQ